MAEVGIGILFAVWFIAMYLFVSRLRRRGVRSYGPVSLAPLDTSKSLDAPQRKRSLTTGAMSEHHASEKGSQSAQSGR